MQRSVTCLEYPCSLCISSITLVPTFTWMRFFLGVNFLCLPANGPWPLEGAGYFWNTGCLLCSSHTCGMITYFNLQPCSNHIFLPFDSLTNQKQGGFLACIAQIVMLMICSMIDCLKENIFEVTDQMLGDLLSLLSSRESNLSLYSKCRNQPKQAWKKR